MEENLHLTEKGRKYLEDLKRKNPALMEKLEERMREAIKTIPPDRKSLMEECYKTP